MWPFKGKVERGNCHEVAPLDRAPVQGHPLPPFIIRSPSSPFLLSNFPWLRGRPGVCLWSRPRCGPVAQERSCPVSTGTPSLESVAQLAGGGSGAPSASSWPPSVASCCLYTEFWGGGKCYLGFYVGWFQFSFCLDDFLARSRESSIVFVRIVRLVSIGDIASLCGFGMLLLFGWCFSVVNCCWTHLKVKWSWMQQISKCNQCPIVDQVSIRIYQFFFGVVALCNVVIGLSSMELRAGGVECHKMAALWSAVAIQLQFKGSRLGLLTCRAVYIPRPAWLQLAGKKWTNGAGSCILPRGAGANDTAHFMAAWRGGANQRAALLRRQPITRPMATVFLARVPQFQQFCHSFLSGFLFSLVPSQ